MSLGLRIILAATLSMAAAGALQQAIMAATAGHSRIGALLPLAVVVAIVVLVFALLAWRRRDAVARTARALLFVMLVGGGSLYVLGVIALSPGVGGNIVYLIAVMVDLYFLLPAAAAVAIHWRLLRDSSTADASESEAASTMPKSRALKLMR